MCEAALGNGLPHCRGKAMGKLQNERHFLASPREKILKYSFKHQDLPICSCLSCRRGKATLNCSSGSIANILPRGNSGSAVNRLYCSFVSYFETPISFALSSKPHNFRYRRKDDRSHSSIFVKKDHFIAGFSSPCLYIHAVTSWRTFIPVIAEAMLDENEMRTWEQRSSEHGWSEVVKIPGKSRKKYELRASLP